MPSAIPIDREIDLDPRHLSAQQNLVRIFYKEMWDKADTQLIPEIFHENFTFRGSLGPVLVGYREFASYVEWLTDTLSNYTSDILDLIEQGNRVSGKLRFHGYQQKPLFGREPTGKHVWWYGAPIFTFDQGKVSDLWVLGDIYGLVNRLEQTDTAIEFMPATA